MGLEDNEKKALVRLQLIDKDTNQVKKELGFGALVGHPNEKGIVNQEEVHLLTSSSVLQDDIDQHLDQIVVDQKKPVFLDKFKRRRDPVKLKEIADDKRNVKYRKVLFEEGDKENYLKVLVLSEKSKMEFGLKTLSAYVFEGTKLIEFKFEYQDGTYKWKNVVKGFDVTRAKGAPVITPITLKSDDGQQMALGNHVVGVLLIDEHGTPYPDLFTVHCLGGASTSSGDVTVAGSSQGNSQQSDERPSTRSDDLTGDGPIRPNNQQSVQNITYNVYVSGGAQAAVGPNPVFTNKYHAQDVSNREETDGDTENNDRNAPPANGGRDEMDNNPSSQAADEECQELVVWVEGLDLDNVDCNVVATRAAEQLQQYKTSLLNPPQEIVNNCRRFCIHLKEKGRIDIVKDLRTQLPSGTTGPLKYAETTVFQDLPVQVKKEITQAITGNEVLWQTLATKLLDKSNSQLGFYKRMTDPAENILQTFCQKRRLLVGELYDLLVMYGDPVLADEYL